jgi:hypothetical protein
MHNPAFCCHAVLIPELLNVNQGALSLAKAKVLEC